MSNKASKNAILLPLIAEEAGIQEYSLANGLRVLLVENHSAPVVTVQVVYRVGSRNEAVGHTGSTHFLEHMLFRGTPSFNKSKGTQIAQVLNRIGANFNATTWLDRTTYYETVPADQLELALQIESERMQHAWIRDKDRQAEMTVVRNELERDENEPDSIMWKHLFAHAFVAHPYHHPTIGWHSDVEGVPTARLRQFYKEFYHPNNASLILVGDFKSDQALALVQSYFEPIPASPKVIPAMYTQEFPQQGERRFEIRRPGQLGIVQMAWHVPPVEHVDSHALDVLQDVLSEGVNSRLYQALVEKHLAVYAGAYNLQLRDPGLFIMHAKLSSESTHEQ
ncbi:MAG TPA: pitrilysin family protein, partial [Candidatus Obscuribacterales bacterium]